jgi:predicted nucleic acid-binding protein
MPLQLIDTNILFDYFAETENYDKAEQLIFTGNCAVNLPILVEITNLLQNKENLRISKYAENFLLQTSSLFTLLETSKQNILKANKIRANFPDLPLTLADTIILVQSQEYNITVQTTDNLLVSFGTGNILLSY